MEQRYKLQLEQMLAQAQVSPELIQGLLDRLEAFVEPFAESLDRPEQRASCRRVLDRPALQAPAQVRRGDRLPP
jgi:hypothetical protein